MPLMYPPGRSPQRSCLAGLPEMPVRDAHTACSPKVPAQSTRLRLPPRTMSQNVCPRYLILLSEITARVPHPLPTLDLPVWDVSPGILPGWFARTTRLRYLPQVPTRDCPPKFPPVLTRLSTRPRYLLELTVWDAHPTWSPRMSAHGTHLS